MDSLDLEKSGTPANEPMSAAPVLSEGAEVPALNEAVSSDEAEATLTDDAAVMTDDMREQAETLKEFGEAFGKYKYLSNEQNLALPTVTPEVMDSDAPFSSVSMAGKWLREAMNLRNYWQGVERFGEEAASYKWAYDEGKLGAFNGKTLAKEATKAGVRSVASSSLSTVGNLMSMFGANLSAGSTGTKVMTAGAGVLFPETGKQFQSLGNALRQYAQEVEDWKFWAPAEDALSEEPSWSKLANVVGSGSSQVLMMGGVSRLIGAKATYGLFAGGGAGEIFNEAMAQDGDVDKANALAAANAGVTFAIDRLFDPLPETVAKNAKLTSQKVAKEMLGAPLREAGSEVLQQMLAENLVRKVGLDDTQDLFEGLLESALGAFAGSSMLTGASGTVYFARKNLDDVRRRIMLKGVTAEELDLYQNNMMALIEQKPEAFEKILGANLKENLRQMDLAARTIKNRKERAAKRGELKDFENVFNEMYQRFLPVVGDEAKARAAAKVFEANAISLYNFDNSLTPEKLLRGFLPTVEKVGIADFLARNKPEEALSYSLIGVNAKNADAAALTSAIEMNKKELDPQVVWYRTGWHKGGDGKWRMEISDKNAVVKPWDNIQLKEGVVDMFQARKQQMEKVRAYLAAALRKSTMQGGGAYYQDFYNYLEQNLPETIWSDEDVDNGVKLKQGLLDIIDEVDKNQRLIEDELLQDLMNKYLEMHPQMKKKATLDDAFAELEQHQGRTYDFTEEQYNYIMGALEYSRRHEFFKKYWNPKHGVSRNRDFQELAEAKNYEYADNMMYLKALARVGDTSRRRREARGKELKRQGLYPSPYFFEDIDKEEAYGKYRAYQGDFYDAADVKDFYPARYKWAYRPLTMSEKFLEQEQYKYMSDEEKRFLAGFLDVEERLFRVERFLKATSAFEKMLNIREASLNRENLYDASGRIDRELLQQRLMFNNRGDKRLGDIFEHKELYDNYPEIAEMKVHFARLLGNAPYHVYHDAKDGYVLEINPEQMTTRNLKEIFLKGAAFAVQDIEGFDYSLTDEQRRNFMNRQIYLAAEKVQSEVVDNLREYVQHYLPGVNYRDFVVKQDVPISLLRLGQTADIRKAGPDESKKQRAQFREVDYKKLTQAVVRKYQDIVSEEGFHVRDLAYSDLQKIQNMNSMMVMAEARMNGGYSAGLMPWTGVTSQGAMDARALVERMELQPEELSLQPFFDVNRDLLAVGEKSTQQTDDGKQYVPDIMDPYDEFAQRIAADAKNYRNTLAYLAEGAYDSSSRTISLFEKSDAKTIVHETFHYFWNLMQQEAHRNESHAATFNEVMGELKEEFAQFYQVKQFDGKWYALDKDTDEIISELPRGFNSRGDVLDAGAREVFVSRFMQLLDKRTFGGSGNIADAAEFYRQWLLTMTNKLEISSKTASPDGQRLLKFLRNKIK